MDKKLKSYGEKYENVKKNSYKIKLKIVLPLFFFAIFVVITISNLFFS